MRCRLQTPHRCQRCHCHASFVTLLHHHHHLPSLLLFLLLLPVVTADTGDSTILNITNRCSYTVWPAAIPVGGGMRLDPGKTWTINLPKNTEIGSVWARTGCSFDGEGNGSCQTGDCDGVLACERIGQPPITLAEFSLNQFESNSFFDISLSKGFNVPMEFLPMPVKGHGGARCTRGPHCTADITSQCPSELKVPGGCISPCEAVTNQSTALCCFEIPCQSNKYSDFFVQMCPETLSSSSDSLTETAFNCPAGVNYKIVFCPPTDLTSSPPSPGSNSIGPSSTGSSSRKVATFLLIVVAGSIVSIFLIVAFTLFIVQRRNTRRHHDIEEEEAEFAKLDI